MLVAGGRWYWCYVEYRRGVEVNSRYPIRKRSGRTVEIRVLECYSNGAKSRVRKGYWLVSIRQVPRCRQLDTQPTSWRVLHATMNLLRGMLQHQHDRLRDEWTKILWCPGDISFDLAEKISMNQEDRVRSQSWTFEFACWRASLALSSVGIFSKSTTSIFYFFNFL